MATIAEGGLFPPIIDAYLPAFNIKDVKTSGINISFNLSEYNTLSDIHGYHVSIVRQSQYDSLLDDEDYPLGILVQNFPNKTVSSYEQTVTIPYDKFNKSKFNYNEYYKVQIRLSSDNTYIDKTGAQLSAYLNNESNLTYFSEWSTVCLIRFIADNDFYLDPFENGSTTINSSRLILSGKYNKKNTTGINDNIAYGKNDKEYLDSYNIIIKLNDTPVFSSDTLTIDSRNPESFLYDIPYFFESGNTYDLILNYTTANLYANTLTYTVQAQYSKDAWSGQDVIAETVAVDTIIGKVNITFEPKTEEGSIPANSKLVIRRANDIDNFTRWEIVWSKEIKSTIEDYISFDDFTIESGTLYKYEINYIAPDSTTYFIVEGPVLSVFDYAFLTGEGTQLCVKFNDNISGFKRNVADNIITTLGSKYPYISRNGNMDYRSFSLSGTIAYEMDAQNQFASRTAIYGDWINVYGSYFVNHYYNQKNDKITQRKFRELVMTYLYDDVPKIFRSTSEGNILVRLTDINLTPNNQIGRIIYDFSCTATEIGEANLDNYKLYNIQDFGD